MAIWEAIKQLIERNKSKDGNKTRKAVKQAAEAIGIHMDTDIGKGQQVAGAGDYSLGLHPIPHFNTPTIPHFGLKSIPFLEARITLEKRKETNNYRRMHGEVLVRRQQLKRAKMKKGGENEKGKNNHRFNL